MHTLLAVAALLVAGAPAGKADGKAAFETLKKLEGTWKAEAKETTFLAMRVIANGTAVLQTITGADKIKIVSASIYSLDGGELIAAHFDDGNQVHLKLKSADAKELKLEVVGAAHLVGLSLAVKDDDHLTLEWDTAAGGKSSKSSFAFAREYVDTLK